MSLNKDLATHEFYSRTLHIGDTQTSLFRVWELHQPVGDSTTPAVCSADYRQTIVPILLDLAGAEGGIMSIGCGNGFVESELQQQGAKIIAIDLMQEAVDLAAAKGVSAKRASFFELAPIDVANRTVLYFDGLLGHIFDPTVHLQPFFDRLHALKLQPNTYILTSFDQPADDQAFVAHPTVPSFFLLSLPFVASAFEKQSYTIIKQQEIPYLRPLSGLRRRGICICCTS